MNRLQIALIVALALIVIIMFLSDALMLTQTLFGITVIPMPTQTPVVITATPAPTQTPVVITATPAPTQTPVVITATPMPSQTPFVATETLSPTRGVLTPNPAVPRTAISSPTITPMYSPPVPFDPRDGANLSAKNTILRWNSEHELGPNEVFDVLLWPEGGGAQTSIGTTREKIFPIDNLYTWKTGKYLWTVRIKRADGVYLSSPSQPFSFVFAGWSPPPPPKPPYP